MAEPNHISTKRKQPSSTTTPHHQHPFVGTFTRSKSQIYVHNNRSGRARSDSRRPLQHQFQSLPKKPRRRSLSQDSSSIDNSPCTLVKDLRARRVFSDGRGGFEDGENDDGIESEKETGKLESGLSLHICFDKYVFNADVREDGDGDVEKIDLGVSLAEPKDDEEHVVLTTPPDADILIRTEENGNPNLEFVSKSSDLASENESNGSNLKIEIRNDTNYGNKSFVRPCSRQKLFKAPGSFSYRRLLPYLMDISRDDSCAPKMVQPQKIHKGLEEISLSSKTESCPIKSNGDSVNESNSKSTECVKESSMSFDSQKELCISRDVAFHSNAFLSNSSVEELSKPIVIEGIEKLVQISSKDENLDDSNPDLCLNKSKSLSAKSNDPKPLDNGETEKTDVEGAPDCGNTEKARQCVDDTVQLKTGGICRFDMGIFLKVTDSNLSVSEENKNLSNAGRRGDDDASEEFDHAFNSDEDNVQTTPPDNDIFGKAEAADNCANRVERVLHTVDPLSGKPLNGSILRNNSCVIDKRIDSTPRSRLVPNQCSRLKLFKTPGSVSYRRMLPFLMEAAKDNSYTSGKGHGQKLEKSLEEKLLSVSLVSDSQEMPIENPIGSDFQAVCHSGVSNDQEANVSSSEHVDESPKPVNSKQEQEVSPEQDMSDTDRKLEPEPEVIIHETDPPATPVRSLFSAGSLSRKDTKLVSHELSITTDEDCQKSVVEGAHGAMPIEIDGLHQDSSIEGSFHSDIPATVLKKGILKRTPRGCRGFCTCLNCSSFRLHAERAFEFSRNQMQDAEEVASDLMKELSHIRNILDKSALDADRHAVICINQVKEACKRASEAEELAQNRLSEMNFDLNAHCRITCTERPRVKFANYVEEKVYTKSDSPNK